MTNPIGIFLCFLIPYIATALGVFTATIINTSSKKNENIMLGFAAGVMLSASIWGLLLPAFEGAKGMMGIIWCTLGFLVGIGCILSIDLILPHIHPTSNVREGVKTKLPRSMLLVFAVALHNIPEGLALGVVLGASAKGDIGSGAVIAMSLGIALQNFPEGIAVTFPLIKEGFSKKRSFALGQISSLAEPLFGILGFFLAVTLSNFLPFLLCLAVGAMFFVIVEELIPESQSSENHYGTYGLLGGFWIMTMMAVAIG